MKKGSEDNLIRRFSGMKKTLALILALVLALGAALAGTYLLDFTEEERFRTFGAACAAGG